MQPGAFPDYLRRILLYDYTPKALWTVPVWWLLFRTPLDGAGWGRKLAAHLVLGPLWVAAWFGSYYRLLGLLGEEGICASTAPPWSPWMPSWHWSETAAAATTPRWKAATPCV